MLSADRFHVVVLEDGNIIFDEFPLEESEDMDVTLVRDDTDVVSETSMADGT